MDGLEKVLNNFVVKKFPWIDKGEIDIKSANGGIVPIQVVYSINEDKSFEEKKQVHKITEQLFRMIGLPDYYILDGVRFRRIHPWS